MLKKCLPKFILLFFVLYFQCGKSKEEIRLNENLSWAAGAVWYQIVPERFYNGDPANDPTIVGVPETSNPNWRISPWTSDWYNMQRWERQNRKPFYDRSVVLPGASVEI